MGHTPGTPGFLSRSRLRMKTRKGAAYTVRSALPAGWDRKEEPSAPAKYSGEHMPEIPEHGCNAAPNRPLGGSVHRCGIFGSRLRHFDLLGAHDELNAVGGGVFAGGKRDGGGIGVHQQQIVVPAGMTVPLVLDQTGDGGFGRADGVRLRQAGGGAPQRVGQSGQGLAGALVQIPAAVLEEGFGGAEKGRGIAQTGRGGVGEACASERACCACGS